MGISMANPINSIIDGISHIMVMADVSTVSVSAVMTAIALTVYLEWIYFLANSIVSAINAKNNMLPQINVDVLPLAI